MTSHLKLVYYLFIIFVAFGSLSISILGCIKSRVKEYIYLIIFYFLFTLRILMAFIEVYFETNIMQYDYYYLYVLQIISTIVSCLFMASISLYINTLFFNKFKKVADIIVIVLCSSLLLLMAYPNGFKIDLETGAYILGTTVKVAIFINYTIFAYLLVVIIVGSKRNRPLREVILIVSIGVFLIFGIVDNLPQFSFDSFLVSSIPYLLFGFVLIYYFTTYLLSSVKDEIDKIKFLKEKYNLTQREEELIPLINSGLNNREISEKLFISVSTVKSHIHNIYGKTGVNGRYELFDLIKSL